MAGLGTLDRSAVVGPRPDLLSVDRRDDGGVAAEPGIGRLRAIDCAVDDEALAVGDEVEAEEADRVALIERRRLLLEQIDPIANPWPCVFSVVSEFLPTRLPLASTSGPPELPWLMAASVWIRFG